MNKFVAGYFQFIKRTFLSRPEESVLGLDLGVAVCRAVELRRRQEHVEVVSFAVEPVNAGDEKGAITRIMDRIGSSSRSLPVHVSISGKGTLIRYIDMPRMTNTDLRKAFVLEADKYFPFPKETVFTDCFILDPKGKDKRMAVLIAAIKKDMVEPKLKILKECGIEPSAVTMASVAVANMFAEFPPPTCARAELGGKAVAVIDIGEMATNLMIISDGIPRFTRDIFIGTMDIARRLANITGLTLPQAMALYNAADGEKDRADLQKSVEAVLTNLAAEIRLSFDYFTTEKNLSIARICLVGDGVYVPGVETAFSGHFDLPLVVWDPARILATGEGLDRSRFSTEGRRMITALGLAMGAYD